MFGPLEFPSETFSSDGKSSLEVPNRKEQLILCVLCDDEFSFPSGKDSFLAHLFEVHRVIIADVELVSNFPRYIEFWKKRFCEAPITEFCSTILADIKKDGKLLPGNEYYLLSDVHEDDKNIRQKLQNELLETALAQQKLEREDTSYNHGCLFCRQVITPTRSEYIIHLSAQHNLQLGKPNNLVYIDQLVEMVENKMDNLQCIYCEKIFKDRNVLKEHMRKKSHKRINPDNHVYDKFYLVNYKGSDKSWKSERKRKDSSEDEPCDWSDWQEVLTVSIVCLFCEEIFSSWDSVITHMKCCHTFDYEKATGDLNFYEQVKLVNYIRRQVYKNLCINCDSEMKDRKSTLEHMTTENHIKLPSKELWNQPEREVKYFMKDYCLVQLINLHKTSNIRKNFIHRNVMLKS